MRTHEKITSKLAAYCQLCQMVTSAIRDGEKLDGAYITEKSTEAAKIAESILDEFKRVQADNAALEQALKELVALKDMKDRGGSVPTLDDVPEDMADYKRRKPLAWKAARTVVANEHPGAGFMELAEVAKAYYERKKADWIRAVTKEYDAEYAEKNFTPGEIGMFNLAAVLAKIGMIE